MSEQKQTILFDNIQNGEGFTFPWSGVIYIKDTWDGKIGYRPKVPVDDDDNYKRTIASVNQSVEPA